MPHDHSAFAPHDHAACAGGTLALAEQRLAEAGQRLTPVRRRTLQILLESHRALGAYDVLQRLVADGFANQPPVAYRALEFLEEQGLVHRLCRLHAPRRGACPGFSDLPHLSRRRRSPRRRRRRGVASGRRYAALYHRTLDH